MDKLMRSWNNKLRAMLHLAKKAKDKTNSTTAETPFDSLLPKIAEGVGSVKEHLKTLESQRETFEKIMEALIAGKQTEMIIGVYGIAGVGKTMLMHHLEKEVKKKDLFKEVVMEVGVPSSDLTLSKEKQKKIKDGLKRGDAVLVIIDNIWKPITIGIPYPRDVKHKGCVVLVITSRSRDVLSKMGCQKLFLVEPLPEYEALSLVNEVARNLVPDDALQIVRKCGGLPLALVDIARNPSAQTLPDSVYLSLNSSFLYLKNDEYRCIFLLCSLLGNSEISCDHILKYAIGESDMFPLVKWRMKDVREKIYQSIESLKKSSLLQDGQTSNSVVMHPIIFQFAKKVASMNHMFVGDDKLGLKQWLHNLCEEDRRNLTHISLLCDATDDASVGYFPKLRFLCVGANFWGKSSILTRNLERLRVLDYSGKPMISSTIYSLKYIQTLILKDSGELQTEEMVKIGNLKSLKILSFTGNTIINQSPNVIANLSNLCMLDLSCRVDEMIPHHDLSRLTQLQELYITKFTGWAEFETNSNISLAEVGLLQHLGALKIDLSSPSLRYLKMLYVFIEKCKTHFMVDRES